MQTKTCLMCERELPATLEFFHKAKNDKLGLHRHCKQCRNAYRRDEYRDNPSIRQDVIQRVRSWYKENAEYAREQKRQYAKEHSQEAVERVRQWRERHPERYHQSLTYESRKEHFYARKEYYKAIMHNYQASRRNAEGQFSEENILALFEKQQGKCAYCGMELDETYHVDHVIPLSRGGSNLPDNLALACQFCNCSKGNRLISEWNPILADLVSVDPSPVVPPVAVADVAAEPSL